MSAAKGTVIDINEEVAKWFEMDGGGRVQLKVISTSSFKGIQKQTVKKKVDFKKVEGTPARLEYEEVNSDLQNQLFWDEVIVAWENLFDANGTEIPCTKENKILLMTKSSKFVKFVADSLRILSEEDVVQAEKEEKN